MNFNLNSRLLAKQSKHDLDLIFGWFWYTDLLISPVGPAVIADTFNSSSR